MSKPTVVLYGATSYSGRQLLEYLDTHREADRFNLILAGRNPTKLKKAASSLKGEYETICTELTDLEGVRAMVERATVVINLAGKSPRVCVCPSWSTLMGRAVQVARRHGDHWVSACTLN